jgi:hypothetical protein
MGCKEPGCTRSIYARGYCKTHYRRKRESGEIPRTITRKPPTAYSCNGSSAVLHFRDKHTKRPIDILVDVEDVGKISKLKWHVTEESPYAYTVKRGVTYYMHRLLVNAPSSMVVDHINRNPKDNRKANLRICTPLQNSYNKTVVPKSESGVVGVSWDKNASRWRASIKSNGKTKILGYFATIEDAAEARKEAEQRYFGEFAPRDYAQ